MTDAVKNKCVPPDQSVPGFWWVRHATLGQAVWEWWPSDDPDEWGRWDGHRGEMWPLAAAVEGWRVVTEAGGVDIPAAELRDRIARAVACLNAAPDPAGDPTWQEVAAIVAANRVAWVVLTEAQSPEPVQMPEQVRGRMPGKREGR